MSDAGLTQSEDTSSPPAVDPDDIDAIQKNETPADNPPPLTIPPDQQAQPPQKFSDFMNAPQDKPQRFSEFMQEPNLLQNLDYFATGHQSGPASGKELTTMQRSVLMSQSIGRIFSTMGKNADDVFNDSNVVSQSMIAKAASAEDAKNFSNNMDILNKGFYDGFVVPGIKNLGKSIIDSVASSDMALEAGVGWDAANAAFAAFFGHDTATGHEPGLFGQAGIEAGLPKLGQAVEDLPIALGGEAEFHPGLKANAEAVGLQQAMRKSVTENLLKPVSAGSFLKQDAYFGLEEPAPHEQQGMSVAAASIQPEPEPPSIHEVARQINPEAFAEYDQLIHERDTYSGMLDTLKQSTEAEGRKAFTPDMARLQSLIQDNNEKLFEISSKGDIADTYRKAADQLPREEEPSPAATAQSQEPPAPPMKPIEEQKAFISDDFSKKVVLAGRPKAEADLAGQLEASRYESLAAAYPKFTAEEWYNRESAAVKSGEDNSRAKGSYIDAEKTLTLFKKADASTIIHEKGHEWTEQLLRLAKEDDAPQQMKDDAETLKQWVGRSDKEPVTGKEKSARTKSQEKFAKGFERYFMEGVAPSPTLAKLFDQFKQWLGAIYQNVRNSKRPGKIPENVKGVFDRILSPNPQRTTIGPEITPDARAAGVHENIVTSTPPEKASKAADKVEADIDNIIQQQKPEIADAISAAEQGKQVGGEAVSPPATDNGPEVQQPAGSTPAPEPAEVTGGGAPVEAEGTTGAEPTGVSGGSAGGTGGSTEAGGPERGEIAKPSEPGGVVKPKEQFVDKAGNIRVDLLTSREDVGQAMREAAAQMNNFANVRGPVSDDEVARLATDMGVSGKGQEAIDGLRKMCVDNDVPLAAGIRFTRQAFKQSAEEAVTLAQKASTSRSMEDIAAMTAARNRVLMLAETVSGTADEFGRALRAFQDISKEEINDAQKVAELFQLADTDPESMLALADNLKGLDTPQKINKSIQDSTEPTYADMLVEYRTNTLVSGPMTHMRYSEGNFLTSLFEPTVLIPFEAATAGIRNLVRGLQGLEKDESARHIIASVGQFYGMVRGSGEGLRAGIDAWQTEKTPTLPSEVDAAGFTHRNAIPGPVGVIIRSTGRAVNAIHSFHSAMLYEQKMSGMAFEHAWKEGLSGQDFSDRVVDLRSKPDKELMLAAADNDPAEVLASAQARSEGLIPDTSTFLARVDLLKNNPTDEMKESLLRIQDMKEATGQARQDLYMDRFKEGTLSSDLNRLVNRYPAVKVFIPFMKIGTKVESRAFVQSTPLALLNKSMRDDIFYRDGGRVGDRANAKMAAGTAMAGTAVSLMAQGKMTGDGPEDPKQRAEWSLTHKPNSIQIGDTWYSYNRLGYLGSQLRLVANMYETHQYWGKEDGEHMAITFFQSLTKSVLDDSWMYGVKNMLDAMYHPQEYFDSFANDFVASWLPFSVGTAQVAREMDPFRRRARTMGETIESHVPGLTQSLYPARDSFGEPIPQQHTLAPNEPNRYANDPVVTRLDALHIGIGKLEPKINGVALNEQQYDQFSMLAGRKTKMALDALIGQPGFAGQDMRDQIMAITGVTRDARNDARGVIMTNYPEIAKKAAENKTRRSP